MEDIEELLSCSERLWRSIYDQGLYLLFFKP